MPVVPSYPGVYIEEIPSGVRTISSIATSITAFIGRALRGPVNEPILINSYGDFERTFGGLWVDSTLGYAVRDFYMNGGSQAVIVRLYHPDFSSASEKQEAGDAAQNVVDKVKAKYINELIINKAVLVQNAIHDAINNCQGEATIENLQAAVKQEAEKYDERTQAVENWAAKIVVEAINEKIKQGEVAKENIKTTVNAYTTEKWEDKVKKEKKLKSLIRGNSVSAGLVIQVGEQILENNKSEAVKFRAAQEALDAIKPILFSYGTIQELEDIAIKAVETVAPITKASLDLSEIKLEAAYPGAWGNDLQAQIDYNTGKPPDSILFNLSVKLGEDGEFEIFRNVSLEANDPSNLQKILENSSKLVRWKEGNQKPRETKGQDGKLYWEKVQEAGKAGDGGKLDISDFNGQGKEGKKQGLYALEKVDLFSLLCIPPYKVEGAGLDVDPELIDSAIAYCKKRRAMLIIDAPSNWLDKETAKQLKNVGTTSENAALFFPRLKQPNPLKNNQIEVFAACGAVAGVFSRTDTQRGIWKAPAGLDATLVGVPELSVPLTDAEIGELNPLGINCLRTIPAAGRVIWGSRTRKGDDRLASEWKYISVRRLALYIQENLYRGTQWVVFEPNDEPLWSQIRLNLGAFMNNLFRQGAFQGSSPKEAYFVKCDKETTTQNDINLGIVNIMVGFAPLKPAEFVVIKFQQMAGQVAG